MQTQCGLEFLWGKWSSGMSRYSSTLFHAPSCPWKNFLMAAGTSWESAKVIQTRLGGEDILQEAENAQIFRQLWGNRSHRCPVTLEPHTKFWPKKMMKIICCKSWLLSYWYMQGKREGIILKTNKQTSRFLSGTTSSVCQTPSFSLSLPWESFCSHEWWLKASSCKQLSELNGWL